MRVVFTHFNRFNFMEDSNPLPRFLLFAGAISWKRFYPEDRVILYTDSETLRYFPGISDQFKKWDEIIEISNWDKIEKELEINEKFWAWPRVYTALLEKEPCCIVDIDVVLFSAFKTEFSLEKPWATRYTSVDPVYTKIMDIPGSDTYIGTSRNYYNGGLIYHPTVEGLHEISHRVLEADKTSFGKTAINLYGFSDYAIVVEQSIPCKYYEEDCKLTPELFDQLDLLDHCATTPGIVYHAMGTKYTKDFQERCKIIQTVGYKALGFTQEQLRLFLRDLRIGGIYCNNKNLV